MIPDKPGFYWVTDTSCKVAGRLVVEVYKRGPGLGVSFLGSDIDDTLPHAAKYLTDWDGPLVDPRAPEPPEWKGGPL